MSTFLTADLHFYHKNILKFCPESRPYADVDSMHTAIINQWHQQVNREDHVWILGDMFFCNEEKALAILDQLPGILHLVRGNHDSIIDNSSKVRDRFASIQDYKEIKINGLNWVMFHYPIAEWMGMHRGYYCVHGHTHGRVQQEGRSLDVGWDGPLGGRLVPIEDAHIFLKQRPIMPH